MKGTNFLPEIAINHKKSIFSKGHDAKTFWGIKVSSTCKNDSNKPQFVMVYGTMHTFISLNKCDMDNIVRWWCVYLLHNM